MNFNVMLVISSGVVVSIYTRRNKKINATAE